MDKIYHLNLYNYLLEIKYRLLYVTISIITCIIICYIYKYKLLYILTSINIDYRTEFVYTQITDLFVVYLLIVIYITIALATTLLYFNLYLYIKPALYVSESLTVRNFTIFLILVLLIGLILNSMYVIPLLINYFYTFEKEQALTDLFLQLQLKDYLMFYINANIMIFLLYLSPIIMYSVLTYVNLTVISVKKYRKYIYILIILSMSFILPPDLYLQVIGNFVAIAITEIVIYIYIITITYN
uniref:Sec-independent protein translocase component TatC n=1 Tax=Imasa heleensis TaxID=2772037 RepID=A0A893DCW0_9EUKA|nr:Sec-independent protein translocase component TatC [Imasa heleensis]QRR29748.1 Sec-independent protein translocase component TatC [Imasa heleensis]